MICMERGGRRRGGLKVYVKDDKKNLGLAICNTTQLQKLRKLS